MVKVDRSTAPVSVAEALPVHPFLAGALRDDDVRAAAADVTEVPRRKALMTDDAVVRRILELAITPSSPYPLAANMSEPARRSFAGNV